MVKPLINTPNMPGFENPEEGERIRQDNIDFQKEQENATPERTSDMQREIREGLYGSKEDSINKLDGDSQYFPNLKTLYESGHIDKDTFIKTAEALDEAKPDEELDVFLKVVNKLSDSSVRDSLVKGLENKEEINENNFEKTEFFKDSKELDIDLDAGIGGLELMLARNYISINNVDGTQDKTRDLSKSMDTSLNEILKNSSNDFKKQNGPLITEIKSEKSLNRKYSLLKDLYKEDLKRDAILGGKKSNEEHAMKQKSLDSKKTNLSLKYQELLAQIEKNKGNSEVLKKLEPKKSKIEEEARKLDAEVLILSGGKNDKNPEKIEKRDEN
ncbi:hypothetical protein HUU51_04625 [Candidatus Gracilibacteria bacterium]|nr:hypothetical protein [Candidatus Gracilibacteria bacterium]